MNSKEWLIDYIKSKKCLTMTLYISIRQQENKLFNIKQNNRVCKSRKIKMQNKNHFSI